MLGTENTIMARERRFIDLYKRCFPSIANSIRKMGGTLEETKDVFQDALIIYYEKEKSGTLSLRVSEDAYLFGIARHLWIRKYKERIRAVPLQFFSDASEPEDTYVSSNRLLRYLERSGQKCMDLLKAFYYDHNQLEQIARDFGFSGTRSATVQKFKCLEKVRTVIKEKSLVYEDFLD